MSAAEMEANELSAVEMMARDVRRMRHAGMLLAEAASYTVREYDGLHRLSLAIAEWHHAIADEGDRGTRFRQHLQERDQ